MTHVLITGASGFIGKHLWAELEREGHSVEGVDVHSGSLLEGPEVHRLDLLEKGAFADLVERTRPNVVVHLAAQVGRLFGEDDWGHTIRSNALMTTFVAGACAAAKAKLVYSSTSEVYGDQGAKICREDGECVLPHNLYGLSKRWGEEACQLYVKRSDLKILRLSMPYGTGVPPGRGRAAINNVLWQAATGQRIPIHAGSERSWCWVGDSVRGIRRIIEDGAPGIYNVGRDDDAVPMLRVADIAVEMTGARQDQVELVLPPHAQTVVKRLSTEKLRGLGWRPETDLREGMQQVLEWVRNYDKEGRWIP